MVVFSRYSVHRHPDFWIDPEMFKPKRFDPEHPENKHNRHASVPFGGGPRVCIGRHFAMMEIKVVVATVLRHFQVVVDSSDHHEMCARMTMAPKHGLRVHLKRREQNQQAEPVIS
jgi:cytochrome P450